MIGADNLVQMKIMIFLRWVTPTDATASLSLAPNPEFHSRAWLQISKSKAFN